MPAMSLMPLLITNHFGGKALQLGWMSSAWGVGLVLGGLLLGAWGGFKKRIALQIEVLVLGTDAKIGIGSVGHCCPLYFFRFLETVVRWHLKTFAAAV